MQKNRSKDVDLEAITRTAQEGIVSLGQKQRERAISYIKKVEEAKIERLRSSIKGGN